MSFYTTMELGRPLTVKDEGVSLGTNVNSIDLVGAGITGTISGDEVTATISTGAGLNFSDEETPTGTVNGSNTSFTLANTPSPASSLELQVNGQTLASGGEDFTLATATITFVTAPPTGSIIRAWYRY
jgi:hypothetical protein